MGAQAAECALSLFAADTVPAIQAARERFDAWVRDFKPGANVDSILEVSIDGKSVPDIEKTVSDGRDHDFTPDPVAFRIHPDGFPERCTSADGEWTRTVKVTTHNFRGQAIVPYLQILYEDRYGGVVRLKLNSSTDAPPALTHLRQPHGAEYFKPDPAGDLSYENEAFKVHNGHAYPKAPDQLHLPDGVASGTPEGEAYLRGCWTFETHVPLNP